MLPRVTPLKVSSIPFLKPASTLTVHSTSCYRLSLSQTQASFRPDEEMYGVQVRWLRWPRYRSTSSNPVFFHILLKFSAKMLSNVSRYNVFQADMFRLFHTICLPKRKGMIVTFLSSESSIPVITKRSSLNMKWTWPFKTSGSIYPATNSHIPKDLDLLCITPSRFFCSLQRQLSVLLIPSGVNDVLYVTVVAAIQNQLYMGTWSLCKRSCSLCRRCG